MKKVTPVLVIVIVLGTWLTCRFMEAQSAQISPKVKLTGKDVEGMMKTLSNWGRWGKEDQLGTLNLITSTKRKQAAALVKEGTSISLARDFAESQPGQAKPFGHTMTSSGLTAGAISAADAYSFDYHGYLLTHIDALCHLFHQNRLYNGFPQEQVTSKGALKLAVTNMKNGLLTRGVLMDIPRILNVKYLQGSHAIYPDDLEAWEKRAGVKVESGDALLLRTGSWARRLVEGEKNIEQSFAGLHASCLPWLKKREVAIVGSDLATDVFPSGIEGFILPVHWVLINAMGTPILDNCDLEGLSEAANTRKRWSFLLTAAPLPVQGGTGSPINPIATF